QGGGQGCGKKKAAVALHGEFVVVCLEAMKRGGQRQCRQSICRVHDAVYSVWPGPAPPYTRRHDPLAPRHLSGPAAVQWPARLAGTHRPGPPAGRLPLSPVRPRDFSAHCQHRVAQRDCRPDRQA
ncbi:hypothetical protein COLO4_01726, partial [Corchorus olitorius]